MENKQKAREVAKQIVLTLFKDDYGNPLLLTDGQADIFNLIYTKKFPRNQTIACTQYGKSSTVAVALVLRTNTFGDDFVNLSGQKDKAQIIMEKVIQHTFDHPMFYKQLELDQGMALDRLRRERSKDYITWRNGGSVRTLTANTRNRGMVKHALTGFGSPNIIEDEASLIPDDVQAMVMRMLGGHKENFLLKIGNPFYRNHFFKSWNSERYHKVFIDYEQALREGRYTDDFIEEMRSEFFFSVLYECKFPESGELLPEGYKQLISEELLEDAYISLDEAKELMIGTPRLGVDIGGGGDKTTFILRWPQVMWLHSTNRIQDTMQEVPLIENIMEGFGIPAEDVAIDYGGLGQGAGDRLKEKDLDINLILFGEASPNPHKDKNMRAYLYHELYSWLVNGGKIVRDDQWLELTVVNIKENSEKKRLIQPKEELKQYAKLVGLSISSPDVADGAVLTFAPKDDSIAAEDVTLV